MNQLKRLYKLNYYLLASLDKDGGKIYMLYNLLLCFSFFLLLSPLFELFFSRHDVLFIVSYPTIVVPLGLNFLRPSTKDIDATIEKEKLLRYRFVQWSVLVIALVLASFFVPL